jgi:hypothetical protein
MQPGSTLISLWLIAFTAAMNANNASQDESIFLSDYISFYTETDQVNFRHIYTQHLRLELGGSSTDKAAHEHRHVQIC